MGPLPLGGAPSLNCVLAEPPGPIDNSRIAQAKGSGHIQLKQGESHGSSQAPLPLGLPVRSFQEPPGLLSESGPPKSRPRAPADGRRRLASV